MCNNVARLAIPVFFLFINITPFLKILALSYHAAKILFIYWKTLALINKIRYSFQAKTTFKLTTYGFHSRIVDTIVNIGTKTHVICLVY